MPTPGNSNPAVACCRDVAQADAEELAGAVVAAASTAGLTTQVSGLGSGRVDAATLDPSPGGAAAGRWLEVVVLDPDGPGPLLVQAPGAGLPDPPDLPLPPAAAVLPWPDGEPAGQVCERVLAELARLGVPPAYNEQEEREIAARLEALGYLG